MFSFKTQSLLVGFIILIGLASPAFAFGAGNIAKLAKVEGQNWRHGDIEDALLSLAMARAIKDGKKFTKRYVSLVYFGNWLRDYSQAIDVGTLKMVSAEAIRLLLSVLSFMTFGYGSDEFELTAERLGTYRPEDHIDNPRNYADNQDARQWDRRLRGPVDEERELSVDPETGMKNYIANERIGIMTAAKHVRKLFGDCILLARRFKQNGSKKDLYEAWRLMGTGLHCLEDFFAHSNYCELALIELGERDIFPHVGRDTQLSIEGARHPVYPITTGTFGGVDFLHSVTGEVTDKLTQNELEELEGTLQNSAKSDTSLLRNLLDMIPDGIFGGNKESDKVDELQNNAQAAQMQNMSVSPRDPEAFTEYVQQVYEQVMPAIRFHDDIMKSITNAVEKIPVLPKIIEQLEEQLSVFVFSVIAPFVVPLVDQIKNELKTGSNEIIQSSVDEQFLVFDDDQSSNPTHSMLAKDHFSNILNEVAGRSAAKMVHWVVPQLMNAIDDDDVDIDRLMDTIIYGVLHHPAQRDLGSPSVREGRSSSFESVREWWQDMGEDQREDYRRKLSREGVKNVQNHKEGVYDTGHGHGCAGKLKMRKLYGEPQTMEDEIAGKAADAILEGATGAIAGIVEQNTGYKIPSSPGGRRDERKEEGGLGGLLSAAGSILGGAFSRDETEKRTSSRHGADGSYTETKTEYGQHGDRYGQAEYSQTQHPGGASESEYRRFEQQSSHSGGNRTSGYGYEERTEVRPTGSGGYEERTERHEYRGSTGGGNSGGGYGGESRRDDSGDYGSRQESSYGGRQETSYGGRQETSYGGRQETSHGGGYGRSDERRDEGGYGGGYGGSGNERREESGGYGGGGYERRGESGGYGGSGYERREESGGYSGRDDGGYGSRQEGGYGGRQEGGYGGRQEDDNERRGEGGYGGGGGYGRRDDEDERRDEGGYGGQSGRRKEGGYGGDGGYQERRW